MAETIDPAGAPKFRQIAGQLRDRIRAGEYRPGQPIPSEVELQDLYAVSRQTVRAAVRLLATEGLVDVEHGRRTVVRDRPMLRRIARSRHAAARVAGRPLTDTMTADLGLEPSKRITAVGPTTAPLGAAVRLEVEEDELVLARSRVILASGEPIEASTSYYPLDIAGGTRLENPTAVPEGVAALMGSLGHEHIRAAEDLGARMPTPEEARTLRLGPGVPVLELWHVAYDQDGRPVEVVHSVMDARRYLFSDEFGLG